MITGLQKSQSIEKQTFPGYLGWPSKRWRESWTSTSQAHWIKYKTWSSKKKKKKKGKTDRCAVKLKARVQSAPRWETRGCAHARALTLAPRGGSFLNGRARRSHSTLGARGRRAEIARYLRPRSGGRLARIIAVITRHRSLRAERPRRIFGACSRDNLDGREVASISRSLRRAQFAFSRSGSDH